MTIFVILTVIFLSSIDISHSEECGNYSQPRCLSCETAGGADCERCTDGSFVNKEKKLCNYCPFECTMCKSATECTECRARYELVTDPVSSSATCKKCGGDGPFAYRCSKCEVGQPENCIECSLTYHHLVNGICLDCGDGCDKCTKENLCETCSDNRVLVDKTDSKVCEACGGSYSYRCNKCADGSPETCIECKSIYVLVNGKCEFSTRPAPAPAPAPPAPVPPAPVPAPVPAPPVSDPSSTGCLRGEAGKICASCLVSLYPDVDNKGQCKSCKYGCMTCTSAEKCTRCIEGNGLDRVSKNEVNCKRCSVLFCNECPDDYAQCLNCEPGRVFNKATGKCESQGCDSGYGCGNCLEDKMKCVECKEGYVYTKQYNRCAKCVLNGCADCQKGVYTCSKCKVEYPQCVITNPQTHCDDQNCEICRTDGSSCTRCRFGYVMVDSKCRSCRARLANCLTCNSSGDCIRCDPGFQPDGNGRCVASS